MLSSFARTSLLWAILCLSLSLPLPRALAEETCVQGFAQLAQVHEAHDFDYQNSNLWNYTFRWENTHNFAKFREDPDTPMRMPMVPVSAENVKVITFGNTDPRILHTFSHNGNVYWPLHPNNTEGRVPYFGKEAEGFLETRYTASRSLLSVESDSPAFTVKAGTNYPHKSELQAAKAFTKDDVEGALLRQPFLNAMAKILPADDTLVTVPEALVLQDKATGEGVLVRDLSSLDRNDRIYVPGLSIPYVGREIARKNRENFASFWTKNYSEALGRAKARLLLNYGLEMETPNSQNILVELTDDFKPTGRVVLRDTVDTYAYRPWLNALGLRKTEIENARMGYAPTNSLKPFASNSHWRFDEAGAEGFTPQEVVAMNRAHDQAWLQEIKRLLHLQRDDITNPEQMNQFLESKEGKAAIKAYHKRLGTLPKLREIDNTLYPDDGVSGQATKTFEIFSRLFSPAALGYAWA